VREGSGESVVRCLHVRRAAGPRIDRAGPETTVRAWKLILLCGPEDHHADTIKGPKDYHADTIRGAGPRVKSFGSRNSRGHSEGENTLRRGHSDEGFPLYRVANILIIIVAKY